MEELKKVLEGRPVLYLATVEGYLPRVRPINHYMVWNDRFYIAMGKHKEAYKQLLDNTNLELTAALGSDEWVRIRGTVNFDTSAEAYAAAFAEMPDLKESFSEDTGNTAGRGFSHPAFLLKWRLPWNTAHPRLSSVPRRRKTPGASRKYWCSTTD